MNFRLAAWLLGSLLAMAAGWAVWRFAPVASEDARLLLSALPLIAWGLLALLVRSAAPPTDTAAAAPPLLREHLTAIRAALRQRGFRGRRSRYRVPFYLLIGPPSTGKTDLIAHSAMNFDPPVAVGGMTWWLCDEAVFVEVPLDALSTDADEAMAVMRSLRPRLPVNGVVLAISPADLTLADQVERRETASAIARCLRKIEERFGQRPPVYAILTKLDLIPGFSEFFDRLDPLERAQPWAFTLPYVPSPKAAPGGGENAFGSGFRQLVAAIRVRLTDWMSRELDAVRSGHIMNFGVQIAALEPVVRSALQVLLPADGQQPPGAFLRGIFLTSAKQDALSIDPLLPQLSTRFAMPRSGLLAPDLTREDDARDFFIAGAIRGGVLPEAGLATRGVSGWRRPQLVAVLIAALVLPSAVAVGLLLQDTREELVGRAGFVASTAASLGGRFHSVQQRDLPAVLDGLDQIRDMSARLAAADPAAALRVPMVADAMVLNSQTAHAYDLALTNSLAPHLGARLESELVDLRASANTLRARLATAQASDAGREQALRAWLDTQVAAMPDRASAAALKTHGDELLKRHIGVPVGTDYVDAARRLVAYKESPL